MSDHSSVERSEERQRRLSEMFLTICGTTTITEPQEEPRNRLGEDVERVIVIEEYLDRNLQSDGLDDAISQPEQ